MGWANDGAEDLFTAMQDELFDVKSNEWIAPLYGRTGEMAISLATIHAAGRDLEVVDAEAMAWGRDVARWSADQMIVMADENMAENAHAGLGNRVIKFMKDAGGRPVERRQFQQALRRGLKVKELTDVLDTLVEASAIEALAPAKGAAEPGGAGGRPASTPRYRLARK